MAGRRQRCGAEGVGARYMEGPGKGSGWRGYMTQTYQVDPRGNYKFEAPGKNLSTSNEGKGERSGTKKSRSLKPFHRFFLSCNDAFSVCVVCYVIIQSVVRCNVLLY